MLMEVFFRVIAVAPQDLCIVFTHMLNVPGPRTGTWDEWFYEFHVRFLALNWVRFF